jgi:PAS domain S-box-containing protein
MTPPDKNEFHNSFALFDQDYRLVDWDEGFGLEWSFAAPILKVGVSYSELVRSALSHPVSQQVIVNNFGREAAATRAEMRIRSFGQQRSHQYFMADGRILLVDERPTAAGGVRRITRDITEERHVEEALTTAEHQLQAAELEGDGVRVWLRRNADGSYFFPPVPEGLIRLLELSGPAAGMDPMLIHTRMQTSQEDQARIGMQLEQSAETLEICSIDYRVRDGQDRVRSLRQSLMPRREPDGAVIFSGVIRDVTREREAADQVELLQSVVVHSGDSIVIFESQPPPGGETKILYVNPKFEDMFGETAERVVGQPASILQNDARSRAGAKLLDKARYRADGRPVEFEAHGKSNRTLWVEARVETVQRLDSGVSRWVVISRDVSERKRALNELMRAKEAAEAGNHAKSNFLANMSHELRTPLNAIIGFTELIESGVARGGWKDSFAEYLQDILGSGRHLLDLINTILDLSKIESGSLTLDLGPVNVVELIRRALDVVEGMAATAGVAIETRIPDDESSIEGDFLKLKQVLLNILSNSVKFTPAGGSVTIRVEGDQNEVVIVIADTGCGISKSDIERVLLPFVQADNSLARRFAGSGLGLAIAKEYCVLHGGQLQIESDEGAGTTVRVRLPRVQNDTTAGSRSVLRSIA